MNTYFKIFTVLIATIIFTGCSIRDGEDPCPPEEGNVRINLYAEKFRNRSQDPLADRELRFFDRISHIRYYLYKDNVLYDQDILDTFDQNTSDGFYTFDFNNLTNGNYNLVVVSNCTGEALTGDPSSADNLLLTYPGCTTTEDFFTAVFPFTVSQPETREYVVGLSRAHGVVRYTFNNLPEDAIAIGVSMENVGLEKWVTGDYTNFIAADNRYDIVPVTRQIGDVEGYTMATFPTVTDERSTFRLGLYRQGQDEPYLSQMISDTLTVVRNQLLDIAVTYDNGTFNFEILMDSDWNGSNPGGSVGIE